MIKCFDDIYATNKCAYVVRELKYATYLTACFRMKCFVACLNCTTVCTELCDEITCASFTNY